MFWERCDAISCKNEPVRYISFNASPSIATGKKYRIWVRVCEEHYIGEKVDPSMKLHKTRRNLKKFLMTKIINGD